MFGARCKIRNSIFIKLKEHNIISPTMFELVQWQLGRSSISYLLGGNSKYKIDSEEKRQTTLEILRQKLKALIIIIIIII